MSSSEKQWGHSVEERAKLRAEYYDIRGRERVAMVISLVCGAASLGSMAVAWPRPGMSLYTLLAVVTLSGSMVLCFAFAHASIRGGVWRRLFGLFGLEFAWPPTDEWGSRLEEAGVLVDMDDTGHEPRGTGSDATESMIGDADD